MVQDNQVVTVPEITDVISGPAQLSGGLSQEDAELLAAGLDSGPLPLVLEVAAVEPAPGG